MLRLVSSDTGTSLSSDAVPTFDPAGGLGCIDPHSSYLHAVKALAPIVGESMMQQVGTTAFDAALFQALDDYNQRATIWKHAHQVVHDRERFLCGALSMPHLLPYRDGAEWGGVEALVSLSEELPEYVKRLLEMPEAVQIGIRALRTFPEALQPLADFVGEKLKDPALEWPITIIHVFGERARPYREIILQYLDDNDPDRQSGAAEALASFGDYTKVELDALIRQLEKRNPDSVISALAILCEEFPEVHSRVLEQIDSPIAEVRKNTCLILNSLNVLYHPARELIEALIHREQDPAVFNIAAEVASRFGFVHACFDPVFQRLAPEETNRSERLREALRREARASSNMLEVIRTRLAEAREPQDLCNLLSLLFHPSVLVSPEPLVLSKAMIGIEFVDHHDRRVASMAWRVIRQASQYPLISRKLEGLHREKIAGELHKIVSIRDRHSALSICENLRLEGAEVARFLRHSLCSSNPQVRAAACQVISKQAWRDEAFLPLLKARLRESRFETALAAANALTWFGNEGIEAIEERMKACSDGSLKERLRQEYILAKPGAVRKILAGDNTRLTSAVVSHLSNLAALGGTHLRRYLHKVYQAETEEPQSALPELMNLLLADLTDGDFNDWSAVAELVWRVGEPARRFAPLLVEKGLAERWSYRQRLFVGALGSIGPAAYGQREFVARFVDSSDSELADTARNSLHLICGALTTRPPAEVEDIAEGLRDQWAANQLTALNRARFLPDHQLALLEEELFELVRVLNAEVSPAALGLCEKIFERAPDLPGRVQDLLFDADRDPPPPEVEAAGASIAAKHHKLFKPSPDVVLRGLSSPSPAVRNAYAEIVGSHTPHPIYLESLCAAALKNGSETSALWALGEFDELPDSICERIAIHCENPSSNHRFLTLRARCRSATVETRHMAAREIAEFLSNRDTWHTEVAAHTLAKAECLPEDLLAPLLGHLHHHHQVTRYFVAKALTHFLPQLGEHVPRMTFLASRDDYVHSRNQTMWLINNSPKGNQRIGDGP